MLAGSPVEIVGVTEPGFRYPDGADIWVPWPTANQETERGQHIYHAVGKLKTGVELTYAQAQMRAIGAGKIAHIKSPCATVSGKPITPIESSVRRRRSSTVLERRLRGRQN